MSKKTLAALIVSSASVCRAPMAAALFHEVARTRGAESQSLWKADSAGIDPWYVGMTVDPRVTGVLRPYLATTDLWHLNTRKARLVQPQDFHNFDYIFPVDLSTMETVKSTAPPEPKAQIILLSTFDKEKFDEILHPDNDEEGGFERCLYQCLRSCHGFLEHFDKKNSIHT